MLGKQDSICLVHPSVYREDCKTVWIVLKLKTLILNMEMVWWPSGIAHTCLSAYRMGDSGEWVLSYVPWTWKESCLIELSYRPDWGKPSLPLIKFTSLARNFLLLLLFTFPILSLFARIAFVSQASPILPTLQSNLFQPNYIQTLFSNYIYFTALPCSSCLFRGIRAENLEHISALLVPQNRKEICDRNIISK